MSETEKNEKARLKKLLADLESKDIRVQLEALAAIKVHGNETVIEPLLNTMLHSKSSDLHQEITDIFNTMKSSGAPEKIMACLVNPDYSELRNMLLSSIWNSGLNYSNFASQLVEIATKSDMMDVFEIETIFENMESVPPDESLQEALLILGDYLNTHKNESSNKHDMLLNIGVILKRMNED